MNTDKIIEVMRYLTLHTDKMTDVKLMKMMYMSDRQSLLESGYPITEDTFFCMNRGPILSTSLNMINHSNADFLQFFLQPVVQDNPEDSTYASVQTIELILEQELELSEISEYEKNILDDIVGKFAHMTTDEIVTYSHNSLPEWNHPNGSRTPISYETILSHGNTPVNVISDLVTEINYFRSL